MRRGTIVTLLLLLAATASACGGDGGGTDNGGGPTALPTQPPGTPGVIRIVVTATDIEDEELAPILERVAPALARSLADGGLPGAAVDVVPPRSILIQISGGPSDVVAQVQRILDEGDFEIPLIATQLP